MNGVGAWDVHHSARVISAAVGHSLKAWDIRDSSGKTVWEVSETNNIRDVDFNPNKQYQVRDLQTSSKFFEILNEFLYYKRKVLNLFKLLLAGKMEVSNFMTRDHYKNLSKN